MSYLCRRTVKDDTSFLCRFNRDTDKRCPIFSIGYILQNLRDQDSEIDLTALYQEVKELNLSVQRTSLFFLRVV